MKMLKNCTPCKCTCCHIAPLPYPHHASGMMMVSSAKRKLVLLCNSHVARAQPSFSYSNSLRPGNRVFTSRPKTIFVQSAGTEYYHASDDKTFRSSDKGDGEERTQSSAGSGTSWGNMNMTIRWHLYEHLSALHTLGLDSTATTHQVKEAYRRLAKMYVWVVVPNCDLCIDSYRYNLCV